MDIQLKRGLLDVCVLAAIKNEESYGYKIIKDMKPYLEMSESTLYTILKRLELSHLLTVRSGLRRIEEFKTEWQEVVSIYHFVIKEDTHE